jgi:sugar lactone lactonase YvrE
MGFDAWAKWQPYRLGEILLVLPGGEARVVAREMAFPNGTVVTPDGRTLIVAETSAHRLSAFQIEPDGAVTQRRTWAPLAQKTFPGGICLDAQGAAWVASPERGQILRVREGGETTQEVSATSKPWACALGGPDRRTPRQ